MVGRGLPLSEAAPTDTRLLVWRDVGWEIAADPLGPGGGIGPGMTFGLRLLARGFAPVGLVLAAKGATSIEDWQPEGDLYRAAVGRAHAAGEPLAGILWLHGERGGTPERAAGWGEGFRRVFAAFRRDLGERVPFLLGQIGRFEGREEAQAVVRAQQAELAGELPATALVRSDDLPTQGNHYTVAGYRELGIRFADAWESLTRA